VSVIDIDGSDEEDDGTADIDGSDEEDDGTADIDGSERGCNNNVNELYGLC
jgi:hypothetical protein